MKIKNAIIVHGPGRSGTTLLSNILALHPALGWISSFVNKYPTKLFLTHFNKIQDWGGLERWNRNKSNFPRPTEAYNFWLHYIPQFNNSDIDIIPNDQAMHAINAVQKVLSSSGKNRFMTKITGMSRHQFITAVFEDPIIIWIDRNPLSIITSYHKKKWGYKDKVDLFNSIPTLDLLKEYTSKYLDFSRDKKQLERFNMITVSYEDLVADRYAFFKKLCEDTRLDYSPDFQKILKSWDISAGTNEAYKKYFSSEEQEYIHKLLDQA